MAQVPFSVNNGQVSFSQFDQTQNTSFGDQCDLQFVKSFNEQNHLLSSTNGRQQNCLLNFFYDKQGESKPDGGVELTTLNRKQKSDGKKRNSQNSIRTIMRSLKRFFRSQYQTKQSKFFQSNDPRYLLVLFKTKIDNLDSIKKFIRKNFQDYLERKNSTDLKVIKLNLFVSFFLSLNQIDLEDKHLAETLKVLSRTGQVKSHPPNSEKFRLSQFNKIINLLPLRQN